MNKKYCSLLSIILSLTFVFGALTSCGNAETTDESDTKATENNETVISESSSESVLESDSESVSEKESSSESRSEISSESESETDAESESSSESEEDTTPKLEGEHAALIEYADRLANSVVSYRPDVNREIYMMENKDVNIKYALGSEVKQQVVYLNDKQGNPYIENTMDVYLKTESGDIYYASNSFLTASSNMFRMGFYYNENHIYNQMFVSEDNDIKSHGFDVFRINQMHSMKILEKSKESVRFELTSSSDPWFSLSKSQFDTADYKYLRITLKCDKGIGSNPEVFIHAGSQSDFTANQRISFSISSDGQYHTYTIPIYTVNDYTGKVKGIRIDINGTAGSTFELKSIEAVSFGEGAPESVGLNRSFLTYADKLHHIVQVATTETVNGVAEIGMITDIPAEKVAKLIIKDKNGLKETLEGVDWSSVEYVGFDIKNAGVFGYILPCDNKSGKLTVTLADGNYRITQAKTPTDGTLIPSPVGIRNGNDFYMGQRIYTDDNHDFTAFLHEAECERHPLTSQNFVVDTKEFGGTKFLGYDPLYGYYKFSIPNAGGFNPPFHKNPNRQYGVNFTVTGDEMDRRIYVNAYTNDGALECSAILDGKNMLIPVPLEVAKNFKGDGENNLYMLDDAAYGEVFLPLIVDADSQSEYTVLHLYQKWGHAPLKQISSIQYFSPYYHLSTGVTETNCVVPYGSSGLSLPDFRSMSAPFWASQPQHNSCGSHSLVYYKDAADNDISNQIYDVMIDSYGPTYADMTVSFFTDDNNIKFTYNHVEMPQTDENRTFFELNLDVVGDVSFKDFKNEFTFYRVRPNDPTGVYTQLGYLDASNKPTVVATNRDSAVTKEYILGDECPYFSFFNMENATAAFNNGGYSNVAMLIYDTEFIIGGEKTDADLMIQNSAQNIELTLNLGQVNLKKGDSLKITGILLPWGSQESVYDSADFAPDQNVRNVRADSLLDPMTPKAIENCEVVESTFVPKIKTTNGKDATFSVKGGQNNITTRVYGFDMLTVPTVYELVDGEWKEYKVASINTPDALGYGYHHDGYQVHYDGDGTFSYSFVIPMDNGKERTFKIVADKAFEGWSDAEEDIETEEAPLEIYVTPENYLKVDSAIDGFELFKDGEETLFRFKGNGTAVEKYTVPYRVSGYYESTGHYAVMKYRIPTTNQTKFQFFDVFTSTENTNFTGQGDNVRCKNTVIADGEWHVLVVDVSALATFNPSEDGTYLANFLRFDVLDGSGNPIPNSDYIDVAYFGMGSSLEDIRKLNSDMTEMMLYQEGELKTVDVKSGKITGADGDVENPGSSDQPTDNTFKVMVSAKQLSELGAEHVTACTFELSSDESYIRYFGTGKNEAYIRPYSNEMASEETGRYMVLKYRIPTDISEKIHHIEIFGGTVGVQPTGSGDRIHTGAFKQTGEWELMVVDLSGLENYRADGGKYYAKYFRLDIFNMPVSTAGYLDIAYFGLTDSLDCIREFNADMEKAILVSSDASYKTVDVSNADAWKFEKTPEVKPGEKLEIVEDATSPAPADSSLFNVYISASTLGQFNTSGAEVETSPAGQFVRFYGKGSGESITQIYTNSSGNKVTGQYIVMKYRVPTTNAVSLGNFEVFVGNKAIAPNGAGDQKQFGSIEKDGEWHVVIYDVSSFDAMVVASNGTYSAKYLRLDFLNAKCQADTCVDIAYVAMSDSIEDILKANANMESVTLMSGDNVETLPTK